MCVSLDLTFKWPNPGESPKRNSLIYFRERDLDSTKTNLNDEIVVGNHDTLFAGMQQKGEFD